MSLYYLFLTLIQHLQTNWETFKKENWENECHHWIIYQESLLSCVNCSSNVSCCAVSIEPLNISLCAQERMMSILTGINDRCSFIMKVNAKLGWDVCGMWYWYHNLTKIIIKKNKYIYCIYIMGKWSWITLWQSCHLKGDIQYTMQN